ncbi:hypothetical protein JCM10213v2_008315 [Rhodosporidiobolus nylandii]
MAVQPASAAPAATAPSRASPFLRPPLRTSHSYRTAAPPSLAVSSLTTRSSSTSRVYAAAGERSTGAQGEAGAERHGAGGAYLSPTGSSTQRALHQGRGGSSTDAVASAKERLLRGGRERKPSKGKGKAVAFVVGLPSSGEEGDTEREEGSADEARPEDGLQGVFSSVVDGGLPVEPSPEEVIRFQPVQTVDSLDLDSLLPKGIADYAFVVDSSPSPSTLNPSDPSDTSAVAPPLRVSLGKGKFSEVLLYALKHTPLHPHHPLIAQRLLREPVILAQLPPHRNLVKVFETIRTPGHFYLVEENLRSSITLEALVSASPGGVLPVEQAWSVLEQLSSVVRSLHEPAKVCHRDIKPENILIRVTSPPPSSPPGTPPTLLLKLLDFGLATHFSSSEPKLTTCCGSPAYHSPELWRSLREPHSSVRYWGPEIDIWCIGLTLLRCLGRSKYPLGVSHVSVQSMSDRVVDALLGIRDPSLRQVLNGFLVLDGKKRMRAFERFVSGMNKRKRETEGGSATPAESRTSTNEEVRPREFKSTSFLPSPLAHRLELHLDEQSYARSEGPKLEAAVVMQEPGEGWEPLANPGVRRTSRSISSARTATLDEAKVPSATVVATGLPQALDYSPEMSQGEAASTATTPDLSPAPSGFPLYPSSSDSLGSPYSPFIPSAESLPLRHPSLPPPIELTLLNPNDESVRRAVSFIKYALRCSGILYHVWEEGSSRRPSLANLASPPSAPPSLPPTPYTQPFSSVPFPGGGFPFPSPEDDDTSITYLHCVVGLPSSPSPAASGSASNALLSALRGESASTSRPRMSPRARTFSGTPLHARSASTPPAPAGRKDQKKKDLVQALPFFLSIRKASSAPPSSPYYHPPSSRRSASGSATPTSPFNLPSHGRRRRTSASPRSRGYSTRIIISLSDDRALPFVRDALSLRDGEDSAEESSSVPRGRTRVGGLSPRGAGDNSGSRDARARREARAARESQQERVKGRSKSVDLRGSRNGDEGTLARGLGMEMGPQADTRPARPSRERTTSLWRFDLAGLVGRVVGGVSGGSNGAPLDEAARERPQSRTRVKSTVEAAAGLLPL